MSVSYTHHVTAVITPTRVSCLVVINVFCMGAFSMKFSSHFVFYVVSIKEIGCNVNLKYKIVNNINGVLFCETFCLI